MAARTPAPGTRRPGASSPSSAPRAAASKIGAKAVAAAETASPAASALSRLRSASQTAQTRRRQAERYAPQPGSSFSRANPRRLVLLEFLVCFVILGLGTIVAPSGRRGAGIGHLAVKGSALGLLFFILGLMAGSGVKSAKVAGALGGLVTVAYVFTSQDAANLIQWLSGFFDPASAAAAGATSAPGTGISAEPVGAGARQGPAPGVAV